MRKIDQKTFMLAKSKIKVVTLKNDLVQRFLDGNFIFRIFKEFNYLHSNFSPVTFKYAYFFNVKQTL